jgi:type I restriction enzyme R subunit
VSNGDRARYGSITSRWEHFAEWKRNDEKDKGRVDAEVLLDGMLAKDRLLDLVENFILFDDSKPGALARSSPGTTRYWASITLWRRSSGKKS